MYQYQDPNRFRQYLLPGERILWTGRPKQGLALSQNDILLIPFSLMWGGFALFWNVSVWTFPQTGESIDWFMRLWGLPFLVAGFYFVIGRFFYDAWLRSRLFYAVTERRVLILRTVPSSKFTSRDIQSLPMIELSEHRDGTGTIAFDSEDLGYSMLFRGRGFAGWTPAASANAQFFRIQDPRKVYELVRNQERA